MTSRVEIKTISSSSESKYKEKGSVFIAKSFKIKSIEEAESFLEKIKKKFYNATHHCFAFRLQDGNLKYSDDGEPNGTAGIRILNAIDHFELTNIIIVVIRYFGGVKLGVGPLGKAYYNSAYQVIDSSKIITLKHYKKIIISADFSFISHIHRILSKHNSIIENSTFDTKANFECFSGLKEIEIISSELNEISKGEILISQSDEDYFL
jgi:uncharacterized YigZ family protein